jgi:hypothetical protein
MNYFPRKMESFWNSENQLICYHSIFLSLLASLTLIVLNYISKLEF